MVQPSPAFLFAFPTAPTIAMKAPGDRPAFTTQLDRSKLLSSPTQARRYGVSPTLGLLQPDISLCPVDDSSVDDSEQASAASTVPLLVALLSLLRGLRPDLPRHQRRKAGTVRVRVVGNCHNFLPRTPTLGSNSGSREFSLSDVPERI